MWWGCLDFGDPSSARNSGGPVAIVMRYGVNRAFSSLWLLCTSENWARRWCSCLDLGDPGGTKSVSWGPWWCQVCLYPGDPGSAKCAPTVLAAGAVTLSESTRLWQLEIRGPLWLVLFCCLVHQVLKGTASLGSSLFSYWCWCVGRERLQ